MTMYSRFLLLFWFFFLCFPSILLANENDNGTSPIKSEMGSIDVANLDQDAFNNLSEEEKKWYLKFQQGLMFFDGWQEISEEILTAVPSEDHTDTGFLLKTIGVKIGTEWCKDNSVRKIHTDDLRSWGKRLRKVKDETPAFVVDTLEAIGSEVDDILTK